MRSICFQPIFSAKIVATSRVTPKSTEISRVNVIVCKPSVWRLILNIYPM